tara:strand:+ start:50 stop:634 length:585 start_codon:yes stop_codon:yes gene_type:complete
MAGFNPFAPQMRQQQQPQMQGVPTPNVAMHDKPSFMETVAPTVLEKAMSSDMAGAGADYVQDSASNAWSALTKAPASPSTIPVSELSNTMGTAMSPSGMFGGAEGAIAAQQAAAASTVGQGSTALMGSMATGGAEAAIAAEVAAAAAAEAAAASALTGAAAGGTVAAAAPAALMAGPFAPLVLGGMMLAANSGK